MTFVPPIGSADHFIIKGDFMRKLFWGFLLSIVFSASVITVSAHSGGTDSSGGHHVNGTSEYHYHHGETAHNHYDMDMDGDLDCPISYIKKIPSNPYSSKYSYLNLSDFRTGYLSGFDDGYESGNTSGYDSGYTEGKRDTERVMSDTIENERKDAAKNAYFICLFYGFPAVAFITSAINAKIYK